MHEIRTRLSAVGLERNAMFAVIQALVVTLCFFLVYRILIAQIGLDRVGIWSLLLAGTALARVGDISGGGALARFVAASTLSGEPQAPADYVHTVLLTGFLVNTLLAIVLYILGSMLLPTFVSVAYIDETRHLLPIASILLVLGAIAIGVNSAIDGCQRADQRAIVVSVSAISFFVLCWLLVPVFGVIGYGISLLAQQLIMIMLGWIVLRSHIDVLGWFPTRWNRIVFVKTTGFALKLQGIGAVNMFFEPLAKFSINHVGGPSLVALYELASRLVTQIRALVIAAATPLVPAFAAQKDSERAEFKTLLERSSLTAIPAAVMTSVLAIIASPIVSWLMLRELSSMMLTMSFVLALGWGINVLGVTFYFAAQAQGQLRWNFLAHLLIAISVLFGAAILASYFGPMGVMYGIASGLIISTIITIAGNTYALHVKDVSRRLFQANIVAVILIILSCSTAVLTYRALTPI